MLVASMEGNKVKVCGLHRWCRGELVVSVAAVYDQRGGRHDKQVANMESDIGEFATSVRRGRVA